MAGPAGRPYARYAGIYDQTGQDAWSRRVWRSHQGLVRSFGWDGGAILDLACGTGGALALMRAEGYRAVGLDLSREMLLEAREHWADEPFPLVAATMSCLPFAAGSFALVTSFYDSLNYLLDRDALEATLAEVARVLQPGGLFLFDLNTPHTLEEHWTGVCQATASADLASIWRAEWYAGPGISSLRATFFVRGDDGRWDRFDEIHDEHGFTDAELTRAARRAGLRQVLAQDSQTGGRPGRQSRRILYLLRREGR